MSSEVFLNQHRPVCPRCDYDLLGLVPADPVAAPPFTCPECGFEVLWPVVLDPVASAPVWFAETSLREAKWPYFATAVRSLLPLSFWRSIHMGLLGSGVRAVIAAVIAILHVYALLVIVHGALGWGYNRSSRVPILSGTPILGQYFTTLPPVGLSPTSLSLWGPAWLTAVYVAFILMPFTVLIAPSAFRQARVHPRHIRRIVIYSIAPFILIIALPGMIPGLWWLFDVLTLGRTRSINGSMFLRDWSSLLRPLSAYVALLIVWGSAFSRYLRLKNPWGHAAVLAIVPVLAGVLATLILHSDMILL